MAEITKDTLEELIAAFEEYNRKIGEEDRRHVIALDAYKDELLKLLNRYD